MALYNFLFIMTDQHRADHLSCYGNPILSTPNLDRIAESGMRFDRFYVSNPGCHCGRGSWILGHIPFQGFCR